MTDPEFEAASERVNGILDRWIALLALGHWTINRDLRRQDKPDFRDDGSSSEVARCHVNWQYEDATITVWLPEAHEYTDERLEWVMVHELMHIVLNEMREDRKNILHEERVATVLAKALIRARTVQGGA